MVITLHITNAIEITTIASVQKEITLHVNIIMNYNIKQLILKAPTRGAVLKNLAMFTGKSLHWSLGVHIARFSKYV